MSQQIPGSSRGQPGARTGIVICTLLLIIASPTTADFESASKAYQAQDFALAFEEFSKLAETGDPRAQTVLGIMYKYGESVEVNLPGAFAWYLRAAEQNYPPALYNVGVMLLEGSGTEQNETEARRWLQKAAAAGFDRAADKLAELDGSRLVLHDQEPVAWSQNWNLRLPNSIRERTESDMLQIHVYRVQVGAMSSLNAAQKLWQSLYVNNEDLFEGRQPIFRESRSGGRTVYRVQFGPFDEKRSAEAFCDAFKTQFLDSAHCLVIKTS